MKVSSKIGGMVALVLPLFALSILLPELFTSKNDVIFSTGGDGFKNLFTPSYYVKYDSGTHFSGMNYPYGEVVTFTDNQPFFGFVLQKLNTFLPVENHIFTILNWMLILGVALCSFFMYQIFRFYGISPLASIGLSLIVTGMAPQLDRLDAHFALAYVFFIPLTWFILIRIFQNPEKRKWIILLFINILIQSWTHLYFLMINAMMIGIFSVVIYLQKNGLSWNRKALSVQVMVTCILAVIAVLISVKGIDTIDDRPSSPYGVNAYVTTIQSVVYPNKGPLKDVIDPGNVVGEGEGYLGLLSIPFVLVVLLLIYRRQRYGDRFLSNHIQNYSFFIASVITGLIVFLYSAGWLNQLGLKYINQIIPALQQFRSIGRLVWISYFMFVPAMLVITYSYWNHWRKNPDNYGISLIPLFALLFWGVEAFFYARSHTDNLVKENTFESNRHVDGIKQIMESSPYNFEDFQSSLGLPITILGPERLQIERGTWNQRILMPLSYQTGLPMMDIMMSRTSTSQALDLLEMFTPPYVPKQRLSHMNDQPVLILLDRNIAVGYERDLASRCQLLGQDEQQHWLIADSITWFDHSLYEQITSSFQDTIQPAASRHFNEFTTNPSYAGAGSLQLNKDTFTIWQGRIPSSVIHEISFWVRLDHQTTCLPDIYFYKVNKQGKVLYRTHYDYGLQATAHRGWVRVVWNFDTPSPTDQFIITANGCQTLIDEVLVRPRDIDIYTISNQDTLFNNYNLARD